MALMKVCPTEKLPQLITFNKYFVETRLGDDSKISMDMWNVYTNEQTAMSRDGIPRSRKCWGNTIPHLPVHVC
jgi:hypothetical protein